MLMSRSSICQVLSLALAAVTVVANWQTAGAFEFSSKSLLTESWEGFDADFKPAWVGSTKKVSWTLPKPPSYAGSADLSVIFNTGWRDYQPYVYKPIELLTSSRDVDASAESSVQAVSASESYAPTKGSGGAWNQTGARYAEVTDAKGTLLARGSAIGEQDSTLTDDSFVVQGRVNAGAITENSLLGIAGASADGESRLSASYAVREPVNFSLSGTLSGLGSISLGISLVKDYRESVFELSPTLSKDGKSWSFDLAGQLEPGNYDFSLFAATDAAIGRGTPLDLGGEGEFEVSFVASPVNPYTPPPVAPPASNQNPFLVYLDHAYTIDSAPAGSTEASLFIPEPTTGLLAVSGLVLLAIGRRP